MTSVRQPRQLMGRAAAELLRDEVQNANHVHQQILFKTEAPFARASTKGS